MPPALHPFPMGRNLYGFYHNDGVNLVDPTGLCNSWIQPIFDEVEQEVKVFLEWLQGFWKEGGEKGRDAAPITNNNRESPNSQSTNPITENRTLLPEDPRPPPPPPPPPPPVPGVIGSSWGGGGPAIPFAPPSAPALAFANGAAVNVANVASQAIYANGLGITRAGLYGSGGNAPEDGVALLAYAAASVLGIGSGTQSFVNSAGSFAAAGSDFADGHPIIGTLEGVKGFLEGVVVPLSIAAAVVIPEEGAGARFSAEKEALVDMAQMDKRLGVTQADMEAYQQLNAELPDPFSADRVRIDPGHPFGSGPHSQEPHGHVGPVDYIPITD